MAGLTPVINSCKLPGKAHLIFVPRTGCTVADHDPFARGYYGNAYDVMVVTGTAGIKFSGVNQGC